MSPDRKLLTFKVSAAMERDKVHIAVELQVFYNDLERRGPAVTDGAGGPGEAAHFIHL